MNNFIFSLNATLPVFLVIFLGAVLKKTGLFTDDFTGILDKYVFKVALPVLLFRDISTTDIRKVMDWKFVLFCMTVTTLMFLLVWILALVFLKDKKLTGAFVQASARGSAAILGIAFVDNIYGNAGMAPLMIVAAVPLYNIYSVIALTFYSEDSLSGGKGASDRHAMIRQAFFNIIRNPIILGIFAGIPFSLLGVVLPDILSKTLTSIAQTATPMALLSVGAAFEMKAAVSRLKPAVAASFLKLLLLPVLFLPAAVFMGFRGSELVAILIMLASPTTVSCYVMARNMGNDAPLTSSVIVMTTLLSSVTLTLWIFVLKSTGLI